MVRWRVERFLKKSGMAATTFGRHVAKDPRLVFDMRRGREPGPRMTAKIDAFIGGQK
jgi:hypothetical protein